MKNLGKSILSIFVITALFSLTSVVASASNHKPNEEKDNYCAEGMSDHDLNAMIKEHHPDISDHDLAEKLMHHKEKCAEMGNHHDDMMKRGDHHGDDD